MNDWKKVKSKKAKKAVNNEQRTTNNEQRTMN